MDLNGKKIAILATNGFEQAELEVPRDRLKKAGATVDVVSLAAGEIRGWDKKDWGRPVRSTRRSIRSRRPTMTPSFCRAARLTRTCCVSNPGR